ncbi:MAG: DUF433 domain-containing protein [bacterium]|nr:DUF433 domain-containing protein [bacterium]
MDRHISIHPQICHGKPCISNHRIPVYMVLELIEDGLSFDEIITTYYPSLTREDIADCVRYARHLIEPEPFIDEEAVATAI